MSQTILLVEDEENDVFFFKSALKRAGLPYPLQVACDGREALNYFEGKGKFENRIDFPLPLLVFLDLKLPRVMGLDVLKWIRESPDLTPVVLILSASNDEEDVANAQRLGANGYLVKPTDVNELTAMVSNVCDFWLRYNLLTAGHFDLHPLQA